MKILEFDSNCIHTIEIDEIDESKGTIEKKFIQIISDKKLRISVCGSVFEIKNGRVKHASFTGFDEEYTMPK